ncbi:MAG: LVIVD repeat-containing protein [Actinomycetota bacterium]
MRRLPIFVVLVAVAATAFGAPAVGGPTAGGLASDNVEHVKHVPIAQNGVGGRLIGKYFYMNDQNKVMIYDVSDPLDPQMTGFVPMPQEWQFSREDLDGNGKILVVPNTVSGQNDGNPQTTSPANSVYIIDVEDKTNPQIISKVAGAAQHTFSCVLGCKWAWGSGGNIIDLRNPAKPKFVEETWGDGTPAGDSGHDVEEVAPGIVMTATDPMMLLDARKDPLHPKVLAVAERSNQYMHGTKWPHQMRDRFLLAASETTFNGRCGESSGSFQTWDTRGWKKTETFTMIDEYRVVNGVWADGNPAAQRNCTAHWIEQHPRFKNGGYVAGGFYDHGTRFFEVTSTGKIKEAGYFMAYAGQASATYWITDEILYTVDYNRGLDILRFTPPKG